MFKRNKKVRVVVFGIFDGIHEGHRSLFRQAREYGGELIAIVGRDEICRKLKNKTPRLPEEERRRFVERESLVDRAVLGDKKLSSYAVLETLEPDSVCLGYDQHVLYEDLSSWAEAAGKNFRVVMAKPLKPELYSNSRIYGN